MARTSTAEPDRCRLILFAPEGATAADFVAALSQALDGGDVASLILPQYGLDEGTFQELAEAVTPVAQGAGVAVVLAGDSRVVGRAKADGIHVDGVAALAEAIEKFQAKMAVGAGGAKDRDQALALGELRPDYVFFGRFGYDNKPEPHPRNLSLGAWWAEMIEVPCIVMAGSDIESVAEVARTGVEFVAVSRGVFGQGCDPAAAVRRANALLDDVAQRREEANA